MYKQNGDTRGVLLWPGRPHHQNTCSIQCRQCGLHSQKVLGQVQASSGNLILLFMPAASLGTQQDAISLGRHGARRAVVVLNPFLPSFRSINLSQRPPFPSFCQFFRPSYRVSSPFSGIACSFCCLFAASTPPSRILAIYSRR